MRRYEKQLIETNENRYHPKYITKASSYKSLRKKDNDKRYIKNWRPISLLNIDTKIVSKVFAAKLEPILPSIISLNQTAYVKNRCNSESGSLLVVVVFHEESW